MYCLSKIEGTTEKDIMKMRNYIKKKLKRIDRITLADSAIAAAVIGKHLFNKKVLLSGGAVLLVLGVFAAAAQAVEVDGLQQLIESFQMSQSAKKG